MEQKVNEILEEQVEETIESAPKKKLPVKLVVIGIIAVILIGITLFVLKENGYLQKVKTTSVSDVSKTKALDDEPETEPDDDDGPDVEPKKEKFEYSNKYNKEYVDVQGKTLNDLAGEAGHTVEEYKEIYSLPKDMGPDTNSNAVQNSIPVKVILEQNGMEFAEFKEYYGWDNSVTEDSTVGEALGKTKLKVILGVASSDEETANATLESFREHYGFGDEITLDTLYKDVRKQIDEKARDERIAQETEKAETETEKGEVEVDAEPKQSEESKSEGKVKKKTPKE